MAKSENHHRDRNPHLVQRMLVEGHLARQKRRLPAARQIQRDKQEIGDQRKDKETHHLNGDVPPHQEDQIQNQHHAKTHQHPHAGIHRHPFRQLFSE